MTPKIAGTILLDCDIGEIRRASVWLLDGCSGMDPIRLAELELAVVEAVTNVIRHGNIGGMRQAIELQLARQESGVKVTIKDRGRSIPKAALSASETVLDFDPEDIFNLPERGLGLALIREAVDRVDYQTAEGGNTLLLAKSW
jgi:anti-sigma regulatory factor (Ser/Thr protein kinase)